jgi:1,4-dihydroxy-2-naphthoyl-CoA hydrolase
MSDRLEELKKRGGGFLPGHLGMVFTQVDATQACAEIHLQSCHMAPNGYLHAGTVVALADSCCGYGCVAAMPESATGFTTIELKSNHLGTAREGTIAARATPVHLGRTTQVWDATVTHKDTGKIIALFRCTQLILYPK